MNIIRRTTNRSKPKVGMEMTATLSLPPTLSVEDSAAAIVTFFEGLTALSQATPAIWFQVHCTGIPFELEEKLRTAIEQSKPRLELVVDNTGRRG